MSRAQIDAATARARELAGEAVRPVLRLPWFTTFATASGRAVQVWDGGPARLVDLERGEKFAATPPRSAQQVRAEWAGVARQLAELPAAEALSPRAQELRARRDALRLELEQLARGRA
jgi:hypothetical protein